MKQSGAIHAQIRREIEARIMSGEWKPGDRIPYEHQLMASYGCSRMTVNRALRVLIEAGLLESRRRAGTFVAHPRIHRAAAGVGEGVGAATCHGSDRLPTQGGDEGWGGAVGDGAVTKLT